MIFHYFPLNHKNFYYIKMLANSVRNVKKSS